MPTHAVHTIQPTYDSFNRPKAVTNTITSTYTYDGFDRRVRKEVDGAVTNHVYDGPHILVEYDSSWNVERYYIYSNRTDEPVAMVDAAGKLLKNRWLKKKDCYIIMLKDE